MAARDTRVARVLIWILVANVAVAAIELTYGWISRSAAIRADGLHSLLDAANNVVALALARMASAPPDQDHPYGHRKFEVIGSLAIGAVITLMVVEVSREALTNLLGQADPPDLGLAAYGVMGVTMVANLFVTVIEHRAAKRLSSPLLSADAKHTLADIFVKLGVTGGIVGVHMGFPLADSAVALGVLGFILWIGFGVLRQSVGVLADEAALPAGEVEAVASGVAGVARCRRIRSRGAMGDIRIDLIVEVDPNLSVGEAHEIADHVEAALHARWPTVAEVVVHVEPISRELK